MRKRTFPNTRVQYWILEYSPEYHVLISSIWQINRGYLRYLLARSFWIKFLSWSPESTCHQHTDKNEGVNGQWMLIGYVSLIKSMCNSHIFGWFLLFMTKWPYIQIYSHLVMQSDQRVICFFFFEVKKCMTFWPTLLFIYKNLDQEYWFLK